MKNATSVSHLGEWIDSFLRQGAKKKQAPISHPLPHKIDFTHRLEH